MQVSALLIELAAMKQADPTAKAVVFSSWSRLLRLVQGALQDNGISHASIAGTQAETRGAALKRFLEDPDCTVLAVVMSTGGGAAGLTLTVASHVFLMEPNLNPGLEAQAAARVYRLGKPPVHVCLSIGACGCKSCLRWNLQLDNSVASWCCLYVLQRCAGCCAAFQQSLWSAAGQTKPTRIIRLLAEGSIERAILAHQRMKLQAPGQGRTGAQLQELLAGNTLADLLAAHP